jgi:hypothetical protein
MIWIVAYVAFLAYAAGLLVYCIRHDRPLPAIGILLSVAGFQLALSELILPAIGIAIAVAGLGCVGYDVVTTMRPHPKPAVVRRHMPQDHV